MLTPIQNHIEIQPESQNVRMQLLREFWFYFSENRGAVIGLWVFLFLVIVAIAAPLGCAT